jgi:S1-C subfamily serine protease
VGKRTQTDTMQGHRATATSGAGMLAFALLAAFGCGGHDTTAANSSPTPTPDRSLADVVQRVKSGVMRIEVTVCDGGTVGKGVGTGFLVAPRLVATVQHVIDSAGRIVVKRNGRELATATVIGSDATRDLALLRLAKPIRGYRFTLANTAPQLGVEVAALGFPLGLPLTLTRGTISGLDRTIPIDNIRRRNLVQTDAAVNPGNSGGPLLRVDSGEAIGLVDLTTRGDVHGIAFAVSSQVADPLLKAWRAAPQPISLASCDGFPGSSGSTAGGQASATPVRAFVRALDGALIESANTRGDLGQLISQVNAGSISASEAEARIQRIINQRQDLRVAVEQVSPPAQLAASSRLLQRSVVLSLSDDFAIRDWIEALAANDQASANSAWERQLQLSGQASAAKAEFLDAYNAVRARLLNLPPLDVAY